MARTVTILLVFALIASTLAAPYHQTNKQEKEEKDDYDGVGYDVHSDGGSIALGSIKDGMFGAGSFSIGHGGDSYSDGDGGHAGNHGTNAYGGSGGDKGHTSYGNK